MRVGLCWTGAPGHRNNFNRSVPAIALAPLFAVEGIAWVGLCREGWKPEMASILVNGLDGCLDWFDTAKVIQTLELVVTVDTAIAHVSGGLGVPAWLLLHVVPDFRWGLTGTATHWYRSLRIFRQPIADEWASTVAQVADALRQEVHARRMVA